MFASRSNEQWTDTLVKSLNYTYAHLTRFQFNFQFSQKENLLQKNFITYFRFIFTRKIAPTSVSKVSIKLMYIIINVDAYAP